MAEQTDKGCGMTLHFRDTSYAPCVRHDRLGHHYTTHPAEDRDPNEHYVLFRRSSPERVAAAIFMDAGQNTGWRERHIGNDGSPDWTTVIKVDGPTARMILRLSGSLVESAWFQDVVNTAHRIGARAGRRAQLLELTHAIETSKVPSTKTGV